MNLLITGIRTPSSIAWLVALLAQNRGHTVVVSVLPDEMSRTEKCLARLPQPVEVVTFDAAVAGSEESLRKSLEQLDVQLDGVLHAMAWSPPSCIDEDFLEAPWDDVSAALRVSAYSLTSLIRAAIPLMPQGGDIVTLTLDSAMTWDTYNWMGVSKAALESSTRYLARRLAPESIRVNTVAAGPINTSAASGITGMSTFETLWSDRSMLPWDSDSAGPGVAQTCLTLLTGQMPLTTGSVIYADGGVHVIGDYTNPRRIPRLNENKG